MRVFRFLTLAGILILACGFARANDITVYFSPGNSNQAIGSKFTIDILADNSISKSGLVDFGFNLVWDDTLMQLTNVSGGTGPFEILFWNPISPESITGVLAATPTSPSSEVGSDILLAVLNFQCLQEGSSALGIAFDPDLVAQGLQGFYGPTGEPLDVGFTQGNVDQVVPEPCTFVLLSAGLTGLAYWRKRKQV